MHNGCKKSINQLQKEVNSGKAPKGIERFDKGKILNEQDHVHFSKDSGGGALNMDGTWKHESVGNPLTNKIIKYLKENGLEIIRTIEKIIISFIKQWVKRYSSSSQDFL